LSTEKILGVMHDCVKVFHPDLTLEDMTTSRVADILETSIDVVEFMIELEENLDLEPEELDMQKLVPKFEAYDFAQLADEIDQYIQNRNENSE
jgi:hypothetical protein